MHRYKICKEILTIVTIFSKIMNLSVALKRKGKSHPTILLIYSVHFQNVIKKKFKLKLMGLHSV